VSGHIPLINKKYDYEIVKFNFSSSVKIYACEIANKYLEENILNRYDLTDPHEYYLILDPKDGVYTISRLISLYSKEKNTKGLKRLSLFIKRYKILSIFHSERIDKILKKM